MLPNDEEGTKVVKYITDNNPLHVILHIYRLTNIYKWKDRWSIIHYYIQYRLTIIKVSISANFHKNLHVCPSRFWTLYISLYIFNKHVYQCRCSIPNICLLYIIIYINVHWIVKCFLINWNPSKMLRY